MIRTAGILATIAAFGLGAGGFARSHPVEAPLDPAKGAKLTSRIPCDGATNPEDQLTLTTTFSAAGGERAFKIERFEDKYCKRGDLGFACVQTGHALWKEEWSADSSKPSSTGTYGVESCSDWGSKETPQVVLTGWYKEAGAASNTPAQKTPWKQAELKKVDSRWDIYEFADENGGTARVEVDRR